MLRVEGLRRVHRLGGQEVVALDRLDLEVGAGEFLRVLGASGSGKSTLLNLLAGLDRPTAGRIETPRGDLAQISRSDLARWRAREVGVVFQSFQLIPHRTALQNVELALLFAGVPRCERIRRAQATLERVGLGDRVAHRPDDLSGGEQQRVALARALVKRPRVLLADEPTGNLDRANAQALEHLLAQLVEEGITVVLVTHDPGLGAECAHRTIRLAYGRIDEEIVHRPSERGGPR